MTSNASSDPKNVDGTQQGLELSNTAKIKQTIPIEQYFNQEGKTLSSYTPSASPSLKETKEKTRALLAKQLIVGYGFIIGLVFASVFLDKFSLFVLLKAPSNTTQQEAWQELIQQERERQDDNAKELMTLVLTSASGLLGSALGFYFSSRDRD